MKKSFSILAMMMGLLTSSVLDGTGATPVGTQTNNSLNPKPPGWYQKAARSVGPVDTASKVDLVVQAGSTLYLEGESTFHNYQGNSNSKHKYHLHADVLLGSVVLKGPKVDLAEALNNNGVDSMFLVIPVTNLISRKTALDENADKALQSAENPSIEFTLESETLKSGLMTANGNLKIAGKTLPITLTPEVEIKGNQIHLKGIQKLRMSDWGVRLPAISITTTSITCADGIEIHYDLVFAPVKN